MTREITDEAKRMRYNIMLVFLQRWIVCYSHRYNII